MENEIELGQITSGRLMGQQSNPIIKNTFITNLCYNEAFLQSGNISNTITCNETLFITKQINGPLGFAIMGSDCIMFRELKFGANPCERLGITLIAWVLYRSHAH